MKRVQLSGAAKRKLAAEKKKKEEAAAAKIKKIDDVFAPIPSSSNSSVTEKTIYDETSALGDCEIDSQVVNENDETEMCDFVTENEIEYMNDDDDDVSDGESVEFPTDAGLWQIPENIVLLQQFWIGKGE